MDNADGKQARKTGSSTSLGLLFDHGADCINSGLSTFCFMHFIKISSNIVYLPIPAILSVFFVVTLEEYYVGSLDFGKINIVNEGNTAISLLILTGFFFGNQIYHTQLFWGMNIADFVCYSMLFFGIIDNLVRIVKTMKGFGVCELLKRLSLFTFMTISFIPLCGFSENWVVTDHPKVLQYIYTFLAARIIISLMISHITHSTFEQFQFFPIIFSLLTAFIGFYDFYFLQGYEKKTSLVVGYAIITLLIIVTLYFALFVVSVIHKFSNYLEIKVFSLSHLKKVESQNGFMKLEDQSD